MFLNVLISWIVLVGCLYVAYLAVREVEQSLARRPFSILLTLLLVFLSAGLLEIAIDYLSGQWLSQAFGYGGYYDHRWESVIALALAAGAGVVIGRDVLDRNRQAICPQCGTALRGRAVCMSCHWGSVRPPAALAGLMSRVSTMRPAPAASARKGQHADGGRARHTSAGSRERDRLLYPVRHRAGRGTDILHAVRHAGARRHIVACPANAALPALWLRQSAARSLLRAL